MTASNVFHIGLQQLIADRDYGGSSYAEDVLDTFFLKSLDVGFGTGNLSQMPRLQVR
jgi:hypothetical protein